MPEGARPELHAAAVPCDHPCRGNETRRLRARLGQGRETRHRDAIAVRGERRVDRLGAIARPEERYREPLVLRLAQLRGPPQCGAQRAAVVARRGLHVDVVERPRAEQLAVRGAIERHTPRQCQPAQARRLREPTAQVQHGPVQTRLQPGGHVPMHVADLGVGVARRHQTLGETGARREIMLALLPRPVDPKQGDPDAPVGLELHRLFEELAEPLRVPVGREPHDLVLVGVEVESQV